MLANLQFKYSGSASLADRCFKPWTLGASAMKRRNLKHGRLSATEWAVREPELRPVFDRLVDMSDTDAAKELNEQRIRGPGGSKTWHPVQVARVRTWLVFQKEGDSWARYQAAMREQLGWHFGNASRNDALLLDHVAGLVTLIGRFNLIINCCNPGDIGKMGADGCRLYLKLVEQLDAARRVLLIASDVFERRCPPELPRTKISPASKTLNDAREKFVPLVETAMKLKAAAPQAVRFERNAL